MSIPYGTTVIPIDQVEDEGHAVRYDMPLLGSRSIISVDEAGYAHTLHLIERNGWPWLSTRPYRGEEEDERQQLELTSPISYVRPTATVTDVIEDMIHEERVLELNIPRNLPEALQQDSDNGDTKWWDVYTRAFAKAFKRDAASWTGMNPVENIDVKFNYTSKNDSLTHRCRVHVTHQPDEMPGHLPLVISYDTIQHIVGHKVQSSVLGNGRCARISDVQVDGEGVVDDQRAILGRGPTVHGYPLEEVHVVLQPIPVSSEDDQVEQVLDEDLRVLLSDIDAEDKKGIAEEARARQWAMYYHRHVMDELEDLISRAAREVTLYEKHMGIKIYRTYLTFYVRYRKWLHGARAYQLLLLEKYKEASEGKVNNPRKKLNGRIRGMLPIHDLIARYVMVISIPIVIRDQLRDIHRPHTLMIHPTLLAYLRMYGFGYNVIVEGLMYGDAKRYNLFHAGFHAHLTDDVRSNLPGRDAEDPVDYSVLFAYTSVPYYQEVGWENASVSSFEDDSRVAPEVERLAEREWGPQAVRLRVVAAERPPRAVDIDEQMEENDPEPQVEENDADLIEAEWNAMEIANLAEARNFVADTLDMNELYIGEGEGNVYSDNEGDGENQNYNEMIM